MKLKSLMTAAALAAASLIAWSLEAIEVENGWVRATVPGQMATGAFMTLTAKDGAQLVGASSPVAGVAQIHEMKLEGDVMKMAEVKGGLNLPAGQAVQLKPGGYHVMLMDLKAALPKDGTVPLTLIFKDAKGVESRMELKLPAVAVVPGAMGAGMTRPMPRAMPASK